MRLLVISESRTYHAQRWCAALARRGHRVCLLSRSQVPIGGVEGVGLKVPRWSVKYRGRWRRRYESYVGDVVRRVRPDVVHIHYLENHPITERVLNGAKLVVSTWGNDVVPEATCEPEAPTMRAQKAGLLERADQVTATTHFLAGETARYAEIDLQAIEVIPFGVDLGMFHPRPRDRGRRGPGVLFLKHLYPKYGPEYFLRSLPAVLASQPEARASMVGQGPLLDSLQALAEKLGVAEAITWHGAVSHDRVPGLLADHDVYVMPSVCASETFGVSAVESQAMEVPVVCSDLPGVREAVEDGVGGILVSPGDSAGLARAIIHLLKDESASRRMGQAGRAFVSARFDWDDNVGAMERVYQRVAGTLR